MTWLIAVVMFAGLVCSPLKAQVAPEPGRNKQATEAERSRKANDFRYIIKERDAQIQRRAEVQRIINFANAAKIRMDRFFQDLPSADFAGDLARRVQFELSRLDRMEAVPPSPAERRRAARVSNGPGGAQLLAAADAPPLRADHRAQLLSDPLRNALAAFQSYDYGPMMAELHTSVTVLKQNLSQNHLYWATDFENMMIAWERQLRKASGAGAVDVLRRFQSASDDVSDAREQGASDDRIARFLATKHRETLQTASDILKDRPTYAQVQQQALSEAKDFSGRIKKVGEDYSKDTEEVEKNIATSANEIFGSDINSEVFRWLLIAFGGIFILIMIAPKFYASESVAENILKAEFLLQFSTVFILTAAIIILGIGNFIQQDQLPVLLAGISGYVLGQLGKPGADMPKDALVRKVAAKPTKDSAENDNDASAEAARKAREKG